MAPNSAAVRCPGAQATQPQLVSRRGKPAPIVIASADYNRLKHPTDPAFATQMQRWLDNLKIRILPIRLSSPNVGGGSPPRSAIPGLPDSGGHGPEERYARGNRNERHSFPQA